MEESGFVLAYSYGDEECEEVEDGDVGFEGVKICVWVAMEVSCK